LNFCHIFFLLSWFQSYGEYVGESISEAERMDIVQNSCPGAGACGGMYTANTMASAIEALGMSLPYRYVNPYSSLLLWCLDFFLFSYLGWRSFADMVLKKIKEKVTLLY
jgi:hypothetical protein